MKIFFDTEFTGLHKNTTLISIGLVDENNHSFYGEFIDYDKEQCDDWIKKNVLNNLLLKDKIFNTKIIQEYNIYVKGNKDFIKNELLEWFKKYSYIELVSDVCHYDMILFIDIFGNAFDIPNNICPVCYDINQDIAKYYNISQLDAFDYSREKILDNTYINIIGNKHNSLYDAKVIKEIFNIINK